MYHTFINCQSHRIAHQHADEGWVAPALVSYHARRHIYRVLLSHRREEGWKGGWLQYLHAKIQRRVGCFGWGGLRRDFRRDKKSRGGGEGESYTASQAVGCLRIFKFLLDFSSWLDRNFLSQIHTPAGFSIMIIFLGGPIFSTMMNEYD